MHISLCLSSPMMTVCRILNSFIFDECLYQMHSLLIPAFCRFRDSDSHKLVCFIPQFVDLRFYYDCEPPHNHPL